MHCSVFSDLGHHRKIKSLDMEGTMKKKIQNQTLPYICTVTECSVNVCLHILL